jgi:hypothetical protein
MAANNDKPKTYTMPVKLLSYKPLLPLVLWRKGSPKRQTSRLAWQLDSGDKLPISNNYRPQLMTFITSNM